MQPCFSTTQCKHFTPISSHIIFINITFHHQIMGPLLAHFIVKSKGFIDHFILFFFILPCPIPFVYLCIHHSHISSSVQVPVVFPGVYFAHYPGESLIFLLSLLFCYQSLFYFEAFSSFIFSVLFLNLNIS